MYLINYHSNPWNPISNIFVHSIHVEQVFMKAELTGIIFRSELVYSGNSAYIYYQNIVLQPCQQKMLQPCLHLPHTEKCKLNPHLNIRPLNEFY